ncbi:MAG: alkaline phosphatase family protein [Candidatus Binataceae bacterium]
MNVMKIRRSRRPPLAAIALALIAMLTPYRAAVAESRARPRIFILMVWDGLRPDFVTQHDTPNLFALEREGVRFARHHAQYPTLTMVNAATLATGAPPGTAGIFGDDMFLGSTLKDLGVNLQGEGLMQFAVGPAALENTRRLAVLNAPDALKGNLLGLDSVAQEAAREGGYVAVVGKEGPAYLFDDRVLTAAGQANPNAPDANYLFLTDDAAAPAADAQQLLGAMPKAVAAGVSDADRDRYFASVVAGRALAAAKKATDAGHPALIVFWQHNPDITQHRAGLGTLPAIEALTVADDDLGTVRTAVEQTGVADRTDMMVVSDHGFATIRLRVSLAALLVSAGLKKSLDSTDVIVAANGGSDLVYLSREDFSTRSALSDRLRKIVNFAEAQEWCGPIFSREHAPSAAASSRLRRGRYATSAAAEYRGWIDGTFAQPVLGLFNAERSPDLIISFAEASDASNRGFTGSDLPAFALGAKGQQAVPNHSQPLVRPVPGLVYSDTGSGDRWTTGMGMHGAAGVREIHNVGAAIGPDFRRVFLDQNPTANVDIAPTITRVLGLMINAGPGGAYPTGRALTESLAGESSYVGAAHAFTMTTNLELQGVEAITTLRLTRLGNRIYLDDSSVNRKPLGSSP